jgi:hypothetical protein
MLVAVTERKQFKTQSGLPGPALHPAESGAERGPGGAARGCILHCIEGAGGGQGLSREWGGVQ